MFSPAGEEEETDSVGCPFRSSFRCPVSRPVQQPAGLLGWETGFFAWQMCRTLILCCVDYFEGKDSSGCRFLWRGGIREELRPIRLCFLHQNRRLRSALNGRDQSIAISTHTADSRTSFYCLNPWHFQYFQ